MRTNINVFRNVEFKIGVGDCLLIDRMVYMLCQSAPGVVVAINLNSGNRKMEGVEVCDNTNISGNEVKKIVGAGDFSVIRDVNITYSF